MKRMIFGIALVATLSGSALGQQGTAPAGYYPPGYHGDTWTGMVTDANDTTGEITLTYKKGEKTQTFTCVLADGLKVRMKDGSLHELKPSEVTKATPITVFYMVKSKKVEGKSVKEYSIFKIVPVQ